MPVMNGEEFVRCMEADEMLRSIPVLVVSTEGSEHRVQQMMSLGAKGYVKKPFSPELLFNGMAHPLVYSRSLNGTLPIFRRNRHNHDVSRGFREGRPESPDTGERGRGTD